MLPHAAQERGDLVWTNLDPTAVTMLRGLEVDYLCRGIANNEELQTSVHADAVGRGR